MVKSKMVYDKYLGPYSALNEHIGPKMDIFAISMHFKPIMVQKIFVNSFNPTTMMVWSIMVKFYRSLDWYLGPKMALNEHFGPKMSIFVILLRL